MNPLGPEAFKLLKEGLGIKTVDELAQRIAKLKLSNDFSEDQPLLLNLLTFYKLLFIASLDPYGTKPIQDKLVKWASSTLDPIDVNILQGGNLRERVIQLNPEKRKWVEVGWIHFVYKVPLQEYLSLGLSLNAYVFGGYVYLSPYQVDEVIEAWVRQKLWEKLELIKGIDLPAEYHKWYAEIVGHYEPSIKLEVKGLKSDFFPPCIKRALQGVPAGTRNFSITVLLTSFLSYARLNLFGKKTKIETPKELEILQTEIIPLIRKAGEKCSPPLWDDRPHEIKSVWYTLGFGYTSNPRLEDSGSSPWYFPPNCEKIRSYAPHLCRPSSKCEHVKNPLTFYLKQLYRAKREKRKENKGTVEKPSQGGEVDE